MKIIVDMMGGDNAPLAVLEGAAQAVKEYGITVVGVGDEALVRRTAQENSIPLDGIELVNREEAAQWQRVERDLLKMQAEMPLHYVRREDYIRGQSVIEAKLDALGSKLEAAQLRAAAGGNHAN